MPNSWQYHDNVMKIMHINKHDKITPNWWHNQTWQNYRQQNDIMKQWQVNDNITKMTN